MEIMVYSLLWVMQDLYHQQYNRIPYKGSLLKLSRSLFSVAPNGRLGLRIGGAGGSEDGVRSD